MCHLNIYARDVPVDPEGDVETLKGDRDDVGWG